MKQGVKFSLYLVLAGLGRFMAEFYRLNSQILFRMTVPQIIAAMGILIGTVIIIKSSAIRDNAS
jgi:prolipoprotein diacylglyceryltransferase